MSPATAPGRGWPNRIARRLPAVLLAEPWAFFVKSLCIVSGLTTFVGPAPGSIEQVLPAPLVYLWSATLVLGASAGLYGLARPGARRIEITGLIWLGTAALVYAGAIALRAGLAGMVPASIVLAFGMAALIRALAVYLAYEIAVRAATPEAR